MLFYQTNLRLSFIYSVLVHTHENFFTFGITYTLFEHTPGKYTYMYVYCVDISVWWAGCMVMYRLGYPTVMSPHSSWVLWAHVWVTSILSHHHTHSLGWSDFLIAKVAKSLHPNTHYCHYGSLLICF